MNVRERTITELIQPTIADLGCIFWGLELHTGGQHTKLCVYIERDEGVTVDDCEKVSRALSDLLDVEDILPDRYTLEVSSPGMDRILFRPEQYRASIGEGIEVRLNVPVDGRKRIQGQLVGVEDDQAIVRVDEDEFVLPFESIARARVIPEHTFGNAVKPGAAKGAKGRKGPSSTPSPKTRNSTDASTDPATGLPVEVAANPAVDDRAQSPVNTNKRSQE